MSSSKSLQDDIKTCFDQLCQSESDRILQFDKYPNGFYINENTDATEFFSRAVLEPTKRDKLSTFISHLDIVKKIGTTKLAISIPQQPFEQIHALKLINESIIVWTEKKVYKIAVSEQAFERIQESKLKTELLKQQNSLIADYFLLSDYISLNDSLVQSSPKCQQLTLDNESYLKLDIFLNDYFKIVFRSALPRDDLQTGLQHGDLHYRNIFINENDKLLITDIDMVKVDGFPFLDLMHFAVHLVRNVEQTDLFEPFIRFTNEKSYLYSAIDNLGFSNLADIWMKYYHDDYIVMYLDSQLDWFLKNQSQSEQLQILESLKKKI